MLIDFRTLFPKYHIKPNGVIQCGAHWAEEHDIYLELGIRDIMYIEPCKEAYDKMVSRFGGLTVTTGQPGGNGYQITITDGGVMILKVACGDQDGKMEMFVSHNNQGQSNSLLVPKLHLQQHPEVVFTDKEVVEVRRLDNLLIQDKEKYNILVLDCQGFEGQILKGASETLPQIDLIYTECNNGQTYEGNMEIEEMDEFLRKFGFERVETYWPSPNWTWGDCAYIRKGKQ